MQTFTLSNNAGLTIQLMEYGAAVTSILAPDRNGVIKDVALGYDSLRGYIDGTAYMGAIVGRYGNRVGRGSFLLDGKPCQLSRNEGENHLHGGWKGFDKVIWEGTFLDDAEEPSVMFRYISPDGEEGYPGTAELTVTYALTAQNVLRIEYEGASDRPTLMNPTHHSYFNLTGDFTRTILGHRLMIAADAITPVNKGLIPTGEFLDVTDTPFDFRTETEIGARINTLNEQLDFGNGYDHNWVLRKSAGQVRKVAELYEPESGRALTVFTDQPGLQFYSGNSLDSAGIGKNGIPHRRRTGLCLETQAFPDSPNQPRFPSTILRPGETYRQTTLYQFTTR